MIILIIKNYFMSEKKFFYPDPYTNIKGYAQEYVDILIEQDHGLKNTTPAGNETLAVIMDKASLDSLFELSDKIAAVVGIHDGIVTVGLLAVEEHEGQYRVLEQHISGTVPGQQVWPVAIETSSIGTFLP